MSQDQQQIESKREHARRDAESFLMLGGFLFLLAFIVLLASIWQEPGHARVVNLGSGGLLASIGIGMMLRGMVLRGKAKAP